MFGPQLVFIADAFRKNVGTWLALIGQLVGLFGVPLPAIAAKDSSQPFPCQHRRCGCMSASDCWSQCCCFTPQERVAWAYDHDVEVPDTLQKQAEQENDPPSTVKKNPSCCQTPVSPTKKQPKESPTEKSEGLLLGFMARQCQGLGSLWSAGEPIAIPGPTVNWTYDWQPAGCIDQFFAVVLPVFPPPPSPPPRG